MIVRRGRLPDAPHTEFRPVKGTLAMEEIHGSYGFSGAWSRKLHVRGYPTEQARPPKRAAFSLAAKPAPAAPLQPFHVPTARIPYGGDAMRGRVTLFVGPNMACGVVKPTRSMRPGEFFRNGERHELWFVQEGAGVLASEYGELPFRKGHYLCVPKGTTYRVELASPKAFFLLVESRWPVVFPARYMNPSGQASLSSPVVETQAAAPDLKAPVDETGRYPVFIKHDGGRVTEFTLARHPFDLVGWEGALYPFAFHIDDHHGVAKATHAAPPMHQTFESGTAPSHGFSVCSFVPQPEGWHPRDVPAPYAHYNVDSDELMFFSNAHYGARKGFIADGSLTYHPASLPHGPQGRAAELSLAERGKMSKRLAVMVDTFFEPLAATAAAWRWRDKGYSLSWHKAERRAAREEDSVYGT
ncbi:MAG: homogentisate 1,2-dioxygenase [Elusimicrobia bacterium]|nr:homogentisate 1,2-dioxygenase [Elusimicrobiota bacterium]